MYKIVINATPLCELPTGIGLYTFHLINNLHKLQWHNNFELVVYYQPGMKNWLKGNLKLPTKLQKFSNSYVFNLPVRATNILLNYTPQFFPRLLERKLDSPDIFHGTDFSVFPFRKSKKVMTIHDLTFIKYPHYIDSVVKQYFKRVKKCLNFVDLILTVSESSKQDIVEYLNVDPEKIYVTPLGSYYSHNLSVSVTKKIPPQHPYFQYFSKPYVLFVSTLEPRKNINNLITAFEYLKKQHKIEHQLILIGKKGWKYQQIFTAIENSPWKNHIHHLSYLSDELLALFYKNADVFVYPSFYEGFGLPILEAMAFGTPVVTSNVSSLPEVAGNSALKVDPHEPVQIAEAIFQIIDDNQLRINLIEKGLKRVQLFSWKKTAQLTLEAYKSLL